MANGAYRFNSADFEHNRTVVYNLLVRAGVDDTRKIEALDRDGDGAISAEEYILGLTPAQQEAVRNFARAHAESSLPLESPVPPLLSNTTTTVVRGGRE